MSAFWDKSLYFEGRGVMVRLEDIKVSSKIEGIEPGQAVTVVEVVRISKDRLRICYRCGNGEIRDQRLFRSDEAELTLLPDPKPLTKLENGENRPLPAPKPLGVFEILSAWWSRRTRCTSLPTPPKPLERVEVPAGTQYDKTWAISTMRDYAGRNGIDPKTLTMRVMKRPSGSRYGLIYRKDSAPDPGAPFPTTPPSPPPPKPLERFYMSPIDLARMTDVELAHTQLCGWAARYNIDPNTLTMRIMERPDGSVYGLLYRKDAVPEPVAPFPTTPRDGAGGEEDMTGEKENTNTVHESPIREPLMNQVQRVIIYLGIIVLITMALIPPWTHTVKTRLAYMEDSVGYQFIGTPPRGVITSNSAEGYKIDLARIGLQFTVVIASMVFGVLATANRKKE